MGNLLTLLGGRLFEPDFCERHSGVEDICTNSLDCSIRPLWQSVQLVVDRMLNKVTLGDLLRNEQSASSCVSNLVNLSSGVPQSSSSGLPTG